MIRDKYKILKEITNLCCTVPGLEDCDTNIGYSDTGDRCDRCTVIGIQHGPLF